MGVSPFVIRYPLFGVEKGDAGVVWFLRITNPE
jgi:hypothetical protein